MDINSTLKTSFETLKKNPVLVAPPLAAGLITSILAAVLVGGSIAAGGLSGGDNVAALAVGLGVGAFVVAIIGGVLSLLSHGMTVAMAGEALSTGRTSLGSGFQTLLNRIVDFLVAGVIIGLAVGVGTMMLFLPGLVAMFFLMFAFPAIVVEQKSGIEAIKRSAILVKDRISEALTIFAVLIGIAIAVFVVNAVLGVIPLIGQIAAMVLFAAFGAFGSLVLVHAFRQIIGQPLAAAPGAGRTEPPPPPPSPPTES